MTTDSDSPSARPPYATCLYVGLGGLFAGVTGPLLSTFVPPLVQSALGDHRALIGVVMAIDNVLLLLLVPWAGAASDRSSAAGRGRLPLIIGGLLLSAIGMALFPWSGQFAIGGVIAAIVLLYTGINVQRSPFQALVADAVPSRWRSLATGSVTFQMCVGAIVFLMLGRALGMRIAFLIAAGPYSLSPPYSDSAYVSRRRAAASPPKRPIARCSKRRGLRSAVSCRGCARSSSRRCCYSSRSRPSPRGSRCTAPSDSA